MDSTRVHLVIPTHTPRHLAACLSGLARQSRLPASIVVSCDNGDRAIGDLLDEWWDRCIAARQELGSTRLIHTHREHKGFAHPAQVRNNGLRALERVGGLREDDLIVGIDGDIVLEKDAVAKHEQAAAKGAELIVGFRICLDAAETERVSAASILNGRDLSLLGSAEELGMLKRRDARYRRQLAVRRLSPSLVRPLLVKAHKPKLISAHYAVLVAKLREVNGFDEEFTEYGYEDDDLGRRLHESRARTFIGVRDIRAYHLWHPTRAPSRPMDAPGYARFSRKDLPTAAAYGWRNPVSQPDPVVRVVKAGVPVS